MNTAIYGEYILESVMCGFMVGGLFHFVVWFMTRGVVWFGEIFEKGKI